jgi:hypothetical protein
MLFQGCISAGVLLACVVSALFWLTYVLPFAVGWDNHNWAQFEDYLGLDLGGIVLVVTLAILFTAVVSGIPAALLIWAVHIRPLESSAHSVGVMFGGVAIGLGFLLAFIFALYWDGSGEEPVGDDCGDPGVECPIVD